MEEYYICDHAETCKNFSCVNKSPKEHRYFFTPGSLWNTLKWNCPYFFEKNTDGTPVLVSPLLVKKENIGMKKEDLKIGMKVRCYKKSIYPDGWMEIVGDFGKNPVGTIKKISVTGEVSISFEEQGGNWQFLLEDIGPTILDTSKPKEYNILKPITISEIAKESPCHNEFMKLLAFFPTKAVTQTLSIEEITKKEIWTNWLIMKGFIEEKKPKKVYHIGQIFRDSQNNDENYILAQVDISKVTLIGLKSGNRYHHPQTVSNPSSITEREFCWITNNHQEIFILKEVE